MAEKRDVTEARYLQQIKSIERQAKIAACNDYIGFFTSKILGLLGLVGGGLEILDPNLLPIVLTNPYWVAGAGLALLTGKNVINLIARIDKSWERK
jgi:hypothetical protein